jgi:two-component system chemotaxis sensor kinase CheA
LESAGFSGELTAGNHPDKDSGRIEWQGESLPVLHLSKLLGQDDVVDAAKTMFVWQTSDNAARANGGKSRYALVVDSIKAPQETLVRSLGRHAARWAGVCGAAELFDGKVALVLDLEELIRNAQAEVEPKQVP